MNLLCKRSCVTATNLTLVWGDPIAPQPHLTTAWEHFPESHRFHVSASLSTAVSVGNYKHENATRPWWRWNVREEWRCVTLKMYMNHDRSTTNDVLLFNHHFQLGRHDEISTRWRRWITGRALNLSIHGHRHGHGLRSGVSNSCHLRVITKSGW